MMKAPDLRFALSVVKPLQHRHDRSTVFLTVQAYATKQLRLPTNHFKILRTFMPVLNISEHAYIATACCRAPAARTAPRAHFNPQIHT
jgi:hypothetical protein